MVVFPLCSRFGVAFLVVVEYVQAAKKVKYWQNCAARGLCDERWETASAADKAPEDSPKGHNKPLGHPDFLSTWQGEIDVLTEAPSPETFWKEYHAPRKPFVIKGGALGSPALDWTDDYIMEHFGDEVAKVEWRNEDRLTDYCGQTIRGEFIHCPKDTIPYVESRTNIRNFIKKSTADPKWGKYIISQMPDGMASHLKLPAFFNCGRRPEGDLIKGKPWLTQMYENNFWYLRLPSGKIGTSTLHFDMNHQIMCMVAGKKEWVFFDLKTEKDKIPMWNQYYKTPDKGGPRGSDDSPLDGERVDLKRFPDFIKAKWSNVTIEKGDCLFTPANLLHYVRSWSDDPQDPRSIALMTMYQNSQKYDPTYCKESPAHQYLSDYDTLWGEFPGSMAVPNCMNHIKMGFSDWKREMLVPLSAKPLTKDQFLQYWQKRVSEKYSKKRIKAAWKQLQTETASHTGSWAEKVFNSTALAQLAKDISCANDGLDGPAPKVSGEESYDARNEYALAGGTAGYTDEQHSDEL